MELMALNCSACGGNIQIEAGRKSCFCPYCGTQLFMDDGSKVITYRTVDEARIQEDETNRILKLKEYEQEKQKNKLSNRIEWYMLIVWAVSIFIFIVLGVVTDDIGYQIILIIDIVLGVKVIHSVIGKEKSK